MTPRIALLHATAAGSTTGIAERIHEVLAAAGYAVRAEQLIAERPLDPPDADAVVIGSAVHDMAWLPPALDALVVLAAMDRIPPLWCFSVAGVQPHGVVTRALAAQEIRRVERGFPPGLRPEDHHLFGGIVRFDGMPLWGRLFYRFVAGGRPGDHRDWPAVESWAATVATDLRPAQSGSIERRGPGA
jgi:menaquinone-dependent protoporphyrinogen oxidase